VSIHRDVDAELRFHFDARIEELVGQGYAPDAARAQAVAEFGDVESTRASLREIDRRVAKRRNRADVIDALMQDARYALRSLRRSPAVSLTIVLTLALGVGVNAAMFSLLDTIYLRPPSGVVDAAGVRRVWVERNYASGPDFSTGFDYASVAAITRALGSDARVGYFTVPDRHAGNGDNGLAAHIAGASAGYFGLLGVTPAIGRFYSEQEAEVATSAPVAVISQALWRRQFDADSSVLGRELTVRSRRYTIVGVMGGAFRGVELDATDVWVPPGALVAEYAKMFKVPWWQTPNVNGFNIVFRARSGVDERSLMPRVTHALRGPGIWFRQDTLAVGAFGAINAARGPAKVSTEMRVAVRLMGVAIMVLLIAFANVVNLLLARAVARRRELALRIALGISRVRLVRLLVTESVLLALGASMMAVLAAAWGGASFRALLMPGIDWAGSTLDWRVLTFTLFIALVAGGLAGVVPAIRSSTPDLTDDLKAGSKGAGVRRSRLRSGLLVAQAALSVVLLVGAVLFVRSLDNVKAHDVGVSVDRLVFASATYDTRDSARDANHANRLRGLEPRIARIPGVEQIAFAMAHPKGGMAFGTFFPDADTIAHKKPEAFFISVSDGYFETSGTKIIRGRGFARERAANQPYTIVINEAMANALWPKEDPIGRCIRFDAPTAPCTAIIGISQTAIFQSLTEVPTPLMYTSTERLPKSLKPREIIVRVDPARTVVVQRAIRDLMRSEFPGAVANVSTMAQTMEPEYRPWALGAKLFTLFGVLALIVAAIGVYSTVSYAVNQRTHEFGVRIALGARGLDVLRQVLSEGLRTIVVGIVVGILMTLAAGRLIASLLYGISANDPVSLIGVARGPRFCTKRRLAARSPGASAERISYFVLTQNLICRLS
jgi:predicted permease